MSSSGAFKDVIKRMIKALGDHSCGAGLYAVDTRLLGDDREPPQGP